MDENFWLQNYDALCTFVKYAQFCFVVSKKKLLEKNNDCSPSQCSKKRTEELESEIRVRRICDCPVETALNLISGKWKARILWKLHTHGVVRFGEMRKGLEGITQKMLTQQLRELEDDGLIKRKIYAEVPPRVEYSLTSFGETLQPVMRVIGEWGIEHNERIRKALKH